MNLNTRTNPVALVPAVLILALLAGLVLPGCARARERWKARFNPDPEPVRLIEPNSPELSPADLGLEVVVWTSDDTYFRVGRALAELALPDSPLPPEDDAAWRRAGLRAVAMPVESLDALLIAAPPITQLQRQRFGQIPRWTPLVRGPQTPAGVRGPDARRLEPGRPRLLARSWIEPTLDEGRARDILRTELTIQIEQPRRASILDTPAERTITEAGPILDALLTTHAGNGRHALVIVAESPGLDWSTLPPPPAARAFDQSTDPGINPPSGPTGQAGERPVPVDADRTGPAAFATAQPPGPQPPSERFIGEWMLASPGIPARDGRAPIGPRKVILVLIPRLPPTPTTGQPRPGTPERTRSP